MASIFHGQKFFLTRTLSSNVAFRLRCLIEEHGGIVSSSPAGATELVDYDKLDSRRPDWISADFIDDSVASGILQDPAKYSGVVFSLTSSKAHQNGRVQYSVEDDARLLHFAKLRGWESIKSVPASTWKLAESNRVTDHSWQSMHEHFRKKLQKKTPAEQRIIMARASEIIRGNLLNSFPDEEEKKEETATTPSPPTEDQFLFETSTPSSTRSPSAREATPATRSPPVHFVSGGKKRLKRKRESDADSDEIAESSETEKKCGEANADEFGGARVVFFKSAWAEFAADPSKKAILQSLFYTAVVDGSSQSISSDNLQASTENAPERGGRSNLDCQHSLETEEQHATEAEIDATLCQLEFETEQDMPIIVYALYYCSGNIAMARAFLKGASPSGMWSPEDDSLLANLMVDGNIDRSIVEAAAVNGSFASMQKVRDTEAILYRLRFLR